MEETTTITAVKQEVRMCDWAEQIEAQQASGMTVQKWCAEEWLADLIARGYAGGNTDRIGA